MCIMNKVYENKQFIILDGISHYIVVNKTKQFQSGHTHVTSYKTALWLIKLSEHKSIPRSISLYLLESLIRINSDERYLEKLKELQDSKLSKTPQKYHNKGDYRHASRNLVHKFNKPRRNCKR